MISGIVTILAMTGFFIICYWAYSKRQKEEFARAAQMPLDDDGTLVDGGER